MNIYTHKTTKKICIGFWITCDGVEFYEDFDKNLGIVIIALFFLINDDPVDATIFGALINHFTFEVLVHLLRSNHITKDHHAALQKQGHILRNVCSINSMKCQTPSEKNNISQNLKCSTLI